MAALKDEIGVELVRRLGAELARAQPAFPRQRFQQGVAAELAPLELLARVDAVAGRLARTLPTPFGDAAAVLWEALASPGFTGWMTLPCGTYVARHGIDHPEIALPLLAGLTPRWSSEGPIRRSSNTTRTSPTPISGDGRPTTTSTCDASSPRERVHASHGPRNCVV